jgi:hydrocephalus-inducing protein
VKGGKAGKGEVITNQLKIGQWTITPNSGVVAPDSSATLEIVFQGAGQKNYEQRMAIDITGRDPMDEP